MTDKIDRQSRTHLSEADLAHLASDRASEAGRVSATEHLSNCEICRKRLTLMIRLLRSDERDAAAQSTASAQEKDVADILAALREQGSSSRSPRGKPRDIFLMPISHPGRDTPTVLAAKPDMAESRDMQVLASPGGDVVVRFRELPEGGIGAQVIMAVPSTTHVSLRVGSRDRVFAVSPDGEAHIRGVTRSELREGPIVLELRADVD